MSPVAVGIGVALVALVVIWLVASIQRRPPGEEARRILDEARSEAKAIVAAAEAKAVELTSAAAESAERRAAEMTRDAEEKSWDLVAAAELQRTQARREAIQVQKLADGVRCELTEMVSSLMAEVERTAGSRSANGHAGTNGARRLQSRVGSE